MGFPPSVSVMMAEWLLKSNTLTWKAPAEPDPPATAGPTAGILLIGKPAGMTSHDVVAIMRRVIGIRRVGHAGTLDPLATGLLVICVGPATRLAEYLTHHPKSYRAQVHLGRTTDTYDSEGRILSDYAGPLPSRDVIENALQRFLGDSLQSPPAFSAIKMGGEPLYKKARRGEKVTPAPRAITISRLALITWEPPRCTLEIDCSAGTYIRSLAHDLGVTLGCGAYLAALRRLRSGPFVIAQAQSLEAMMVGEAWREHLLPIDAGLEDMGAFILEPAEVIAVQNGRPIKGPKPQEDEVVRAYGNDKLVAMLEYDASQDIWRPKKVLSS